MAQIEMCSSDGYLDAEGVWCQIFAPAATPGPALFLDRDGVLVEEVGYLSRTEDIRIVPGAAAVVARANSRGVPVVVVTNQAGIGHGYYGWNEFSAVQAALQASLAKEQAHFDAVFACAHHPDGKGALAHPNHPARKPNPGMLLRAATYLSVDLSHSWLVGDKLLDMQAAQNAGLAGALHVLTGHGAAERAAVVASMSADFDIRLGPSIVAAADLPLWS